MKFIRLTIFLLLFSAALLAADSAQAAIAHVQSAGNRENFAGTTIAKAFGSNVTAGNLIVVTAACWGIAISSVTDSLGNTYTQAVSGSVGGVSNSYKIYYAKNITGGANTVTVNCSASASYRWISIHEYSGASTTDPFDVGAGSSSTRAGVVETDGNYTNNITTAGAGELIVAATLNEPANWTTINAGTGLTERYDSGIDYEAEDKIQAVAGSTNATWTPDNTDAYSWIIAAFKPVNVAPTLTVSQPDGTSDTVTGGSKYLVTYTLSDPDDVATADFYYDTNGSGLDGQPMTGCTGVPEGTNATCLWDTTGVPPDTYYVYGVTRYTTTAPNTGLIGHWKMDDGSGGYAADSSANAKDATLSGPTWTSGKIGGALDFDGTDDYAYIPGSIEIYNADPGETKTFSAWFKAGTQAADSNILWNQGGCLGWDIKLDTSGNIQLGFNTGPSDCTGFTSYWVSTSGTNYANGVWHLVTGVIDRPNNTIELYVDGASKGTDTIDTNGAPGDYMRFGTNWNNSAPFDGIIDDVRAYDIALDATESSDLYTSVVGAVMTAYSSGEATINAPAAIDSATILFPPNNLGLVGYWPFEEGMGGKAGDASGNRYENSEATNVTNSLVAHWKLDENPAIHNTTIADSSGNGHSGTLITNNGSTNKSVGGEISQAVDFDGTDDYVDVGTFNFGGAFTMSAWVNIDTGASSIQTIMANSLTGNTANGFRIFVNTWETSDQRLMIETGNGSAGDNAISATGAVPYPGWHHIVAVLNRTNGLANAYVDGVQVITDDGILTDFGNNQATRIGRMNTSYALNGKMDDVRVYSSALSASEVGQIYDLYEKKFTKNDGIIYSAVASDDFNRASLGSNWSQQTGNVGTIIIDSSLYAVSSGSSDNLVYWNANTFSNDQYSQATLVMNANASDGYNEYGVSVRSSTSQATYYIAWVSLYDENPWHIFKSVDNTWTDLVSTSNGSPQAGDVVRLTAVGNILTLYVNGVQKLQTTDSSITSGYPGIYSGDSANRLDNWEGGDVTGTWVDGKRGEALSFDGTSDYVGVGDVHDGIKTVAFWMKADTTTESIMDLNGTATIGVSAGTITVNSGPNSGPSFINAAHYDSAGSGSAVVNKPTGTADNDIMFALIMRASNVDPYIVPSGWTLLASQDIFHKYWLYWKIARNEGSSYTWTWSPSEQTAVTIATYRGGFDSNDPIDVISNTAYTVANTTVRAASMNVTQINSPLIFFGIMYAISNRTFTKPSAPSSDWVENYDGGQSTSDYFREINSMIWSSSGNTGDMDATASGTATNNYKHAFAVALNPPPVTIYVDGELSSTVDTGWHHVTITSDAGIDVSALEIGRVGSSYFDGLIDEVRIYNRALSAGEVANLYTRSQMIAKVKAVSNTGLVGYWPFEEGMGSKAGDHSGNRNDGTILSKVASDDFNRTNENPLASPWALAKGYADGLKIVSNAVLPAVSQTDGFMYHTGTFSADQFSRAKMPTFTANDHSLALTVRNITSGSLDNSYALLVYTPLGVPTQRLFKNINGVSTALGTGTTYTPNASDVWEVRIAGTTLSYYRNGSLEEAVTVTDLSTGNPGIGAWVDASTLDDWEGGDVTGTWVDGKRGKALDFDGASQSVQLTSVPANNLTNFTISGWFNTTSTQIGDIYLEKSSASVWAGNIDININEIGNGKLNFVWRNTSDTIFNASGADVLNDGKWHHFSAVREGSSMRLYTDGALASSSSGLTGNIDATTAQISASQFGGRAFNGKIDEVRIYNRALSAGEVLGLYQKSKMLTKVNTSQNSKLTDGLVGLWSFNGPDIDWPSNTAMDRSGQGNNGDMREITTSGLVGHWKLDENPAIHNSSIADSSGQGNAGTLTTNDGSTNKSVTGQIDQAVNFDGTDDYVDVGDPTPLGSTTTFAVWAYIDTLDNINMSFISKRDVANSATEYQFGITNTNKLKVSFVSSGTSCCVDYTEDTTSLATGSWYHFAATFDDSANQLRWYVNGVNTETDTVTQSFGTDTATKATIGASKEGSGEYFSGRLDEVRIYNRALSASEVAQIYNNSSGLKPAIGRVGQALSFDGTSDYMNIGDPADGSLDFGASQDFTLVTWVNTKQGMVLDQYPTIIHKESGAPKYGYQMTLHNSTTDAKWFGQIWVNGTNYDVNGSTDVADGQWHQLVLQRSGSNILSYQDGAYANTTLASSSSLATSTNFRIGATTFGSPYDYFFDGKVDEVRIYNRALSAAEIQKLYRMSGGR